MNLSQLILGLFFASVAIGQSQELAIVGGQNAIEEEYPWMAQLKLGGYTFCGGTLIAPNWILTAAHCTDISPSNIIINSIYADSIQSFSEEVFVESIHNHNAFNLANFNEGYDIALIKINPPVTSISPVPIHSLNSDEVELNDSLLVMGWGITSDTSEVPSSTLLYAYPKAKIINQTHIYAGYDSTEAIAGACIGDSGGPLLKNVDGTLTQVGIVSGGSGIVTSAGNPSFYTRVYSYANWIDSVMTSESEPVDLTEWSQNLDVRLINGVLSIDFIESLSKPVTFNLVNLKGCIVYTDVVQENSTFNLNHLNTGLYIFQIIGKEQNYSQKLIKH